VQKKKKINFTIIGQPTWEKVNEDLFLDKPLQVIYRITAN
jgi:hypothetical protein